MQLMGLWKVNSRSWEMSTLPPTFNVVKVAARENEYFTTMPLKEAMPFLLTFATLKLSVGTGLRSPLGSL